MKSNVYPPERGETWKEKRKKIKYQFLPRLLPPLVKFYPSFSLLIQAQDKAQYITRTLHPSTATRYPTKTIGNEKHTARGGDKTQPERTILIPSPLSLEKKKTVARSKRERKKGGYSQVLAVCMCTCVRWLLVHARTPDPKQVPR